MAATATATETATAGYVTATATETATAGYVTATAAPIAKRKPVFVTVDKLKPGTSGHTLTVKVLRSTVVSSGVSKPKQPMAQAPRARIAECLVGDATGCIIFTARKDQVDIMKPGATLILRNAKVDMFKDFMRLAVDRWGRIEEAESADFVVNEDNNVSLVQYELIEV